MWYSQSLRQVLWGARELQAAGLRTGPPALDGPLGGGAACRRGDSSALPVATGLLLLQHGRFLLICSVMKGPVQLCGSNGRKTFTEHRPTPASSLRPLLAPAWAPLLLAPACPQQELEASLAHQVTMPVAPIHYAHAEPLHQFLKIINRDILWLTPE